MRFILFLAPLLALSQIGPFDGKEFHGRIAWSADGNHNDEDDWAASPVALAIFAEFGAKEKLVHFDYNSILTSTDPEWEKKHEDGVLGAANRYGYDSSKFFDCQKNLDGAIDNIARIINESSAENPLYFVIAGPMEVAYRGIQKSDPERRKYVYAISHSRWNDGFSTNYTYNYNKRNVIPSGVNWVQIRDQNAFLSTSPYGRHARPKEWRPFHWMRDSRDEKVRFLWERLRVSTRADCSDAGMAYFLMSGDEESETWKVRRLLDDKVVPTPIDPRKVIRVEAENFITLDNYELEHKNDRKVSHRINVKLSDSGQGRLVTALRQPYTATRGRYNVDVRYFDEAGGQSRFTLFVDGEQQGEPWRAAADDDKWKTQSVAGVNVNSGSEIAIAVAGDGSESAKLDYIQFNYIGAPTFVVTGRLDDEMALPGQVIVAGDGPGYLKYNGGGPMFLSGPDNPEDFLFRGTLNPDGTRSGGGQVEMIERMARAGINAFHCQMFRMKVCNYKNEGDDTHAPFVDHDPSMPLNETMLDQWDEWLALFEEKGIIVHLEFYNDATDVERMGWKLDAAGNMHPDEQRWIEGIVNRFKHHKNILWGIEESANKLPGKRTPHFQKIGEVIAKTDTYNHPIVQSFVAPNDPDGDFPDGGVLSDPYEGDPNIRVTTWLHVVPHKDDLEAQHQEYLKYYKLDGERFVVMKNEIFHHPRRGALSRQYVWSAAMAGLHSLEAYHHADDGSMATLADDGRLNIFFKQTAFHRMKPRDDLAAGSTKWVLAEPGKTYVAYTYDYAGPMGVQGVRPGEYSLKWFDPVDGDVVTETVTVPSRGSATWAKPTVVGSEVALYVASHSGRRDRGSARGPK